MKQIVYPAQKRRPGEMLARTGRCRRIVACVAVLASSIVTVTVAATSPNASAAPVSVLTAYVTDSGGDGVVPVQIPNDSTYTVGQEGSTGTITHPIGVAVSPDGSTIYTSLSTNCCANEPGTTIDVIDAGSGAVTDSINLGAPVEPWDLAITPDGRKLIVGNYDADSIEIVDLIASPPAVSTVDLSSVAPNSNAPFVASSPDGSTAYVDAGSELVPVSVANGALGSPVALPTAYDSSASCGNGGLAVNTLGTIVAVACSYADVDFVDLSTGVVTPVQLNASAIGTANNVAFTPNGKSLVVSWADDINGGQVSVLDAAVVPPSIVKTLVLPNESAPGGVAVLPDASTALVAGSTTAQLFVVHLDSSPPSLDSTTIPTGGVPQMIALAVPPPVIPTVTSLLPSSGSATGGTSVEIYGSGFAGSSTVDAVYFGSVAAASFTVDSDSEITAASPAGAVGTVDVTVQGSSGSTSTATSADKFTYAQQASPEPYNPLPPSRICDTRGGQSQPACPGAGALGPGSTLTVQAAGNGEIPSSGVTAVVVNVTVTGTTASSFLTAYPAGSARPSSSNLNWVAGQTVPNLVTVGLGSQGAFDVYNYAGSADVVIDVAGYYSPSSSGALYNALTPARICDTRPGNPSGLSGGALSQCEGHAPSSRTSLTLLVAGLGGVPASGVEAAVLNVTAIDPSSGGYLTVYPAGGKVPLASSVNYSAGEVVPNRVIVPLASDGDVSIYSSAGTPNLAVDVSGWLSGGSSAAGATFTPAISPTRVCDTRSGLSYMTPCEGKTLDSTSSLVVQIAGMGGVPASATSVVLNVTATRATASSFLSVYPDGSPRPTISDLNWAAGRTVPNLVIVKLGASGQVSFFNNAGSIDIIADVVGWYQ